MKCTKLLFVLIIPFVIVPNVVSAETLFDNDINILAAGGSRREIEINEPGEISIEVDITKGSDLDLIFFEFSTYAFGAYDPNFGDDSSDAILFKQSISDRTYTVKINTAATYVIQFNNDNYAEASLHLTIILIPAPLEGANNSEEADGFSLSLSFVPIIFALLILSTRVSKKS